MAATHRTASRLLQSTAQAPYICTSCRSQPVARYTRRMASTTSVVAPKTTTNKSSKAVKSVSSTSTRFAGPSDDPNYVPASSWEGLEKVGSKEWLRKMRDPGDAFQGWSRKGREEITTANIGAIMDKVRDSLSVHGIVEDTLPITDLAVKRQLVASVAQITGVRLSDFLIQGPVTLWTVRNLLLAKPKTRELTSEKTKKAAALPNVQISMRRQTRFDQDEAKGAWKLIRKGLEERNLPVYASQSTKLKKLL